MLANTCNAEIIEAEQVQAEAQMGFLDKHVGRVLRQGPLSGRTTSHMPTLYAAALHVAAGEEQNRAGSFANFWSRLKAYSKAQRADETSLENGVFTR